MAEQVVDIRERIERMRTQIDVVPSSDNKLKQDNSEKVINVTSEKTPDSKNTLIDEKNINKEAKKINENKIINDDVKKNFENVKLVEGKKNSPSQQPTNNEFINNKEHSHEKEKVSTESLQIPANVNSKQESNQKTYKNYEYNNTFDSSNKKIEEDSLTQKFPQFSLNINNPISWKLMLLIMLMQLLTNIMLVVVLYLK